MTYRWGSGSNDNEGVLHILQNWSLTNRWSFMSYLGSPFMRRAKFYPNCRKYCQNILSPTIRVNIQMNINGVISLDKANLPSSIISKNLSDTFGIIRGVFILNWFIIDEICHFFLILFITVYHSFTFHWNDKKIS